MIFHFCLRTIGSEAISRLVGPYPQWAIEPMYYYMLSRRLKDFVLCNIHYLRNINIAYNINLQRMYYLYLKLTVQNNTNAMELLADVQLHLSVIEPKPRTTFNS
jgi:hypothetical protein